MKEIKKDELELLKKNCVIRNSNMGFVDNKGYIIGYYRTKNKRFIEDKYVDLAKQLY